jgi:SAM-dependent methyltransferase
MPLNRLLDRARALLSRSTPIPPKDFIVLVAGTDDVPWFLTIGTRGAESLRDILRKNGIDIARLGSILDFGCGCGRVMRHLPAMTTAKLFGCDYNKAMVAWCKRNLRFAEFQANEAVGRLSYGDDSFDLI